MSVKKIITLSMGIITAFALSACNTFHGIGKDVQAGGQAVQTAADSAKSTPHHHTVVTDNQGTYTTEANQ